MTPPPSPRRRKVRMHRPDGPPDDATLLIRATPASIDEATLDIAEDALESAAVYDVERPGGGRVALYGVSVFARRPGASPVEVLRRFASWPYYLEASAGAVRAAGFDVLPTGAKPGSLRRAARRRPRPRRPAPSAHRAARRRRAPRGRVR